MIVTLSLYFYSLSYLTYGYDFVLREIDREEFKKVMALMRSHNRQGAFQKRGLRTGLKVGGHVENGGLVHYFFGEDGNDRLQHDKFVQFLRDLHHEVCSCLQA